MSRKDKGVSDINATAARAWSQNEGDKMTRQDLDDALGWLVVNGLVRVGLKNGEVAYQRIPNSELSDEAKAFAACHGLDLSDNPGVVM